MLAFIRGPDPFVSKGAIYLKLPPEGAPVLPTHDDTMKMSPVLSRWFADCLHRARTLGHLDRADVS
jgi:hypothetical protein